MTASLRDTIQQLAAEFASGVLGAIRGSSLEDILAEAGGRRGPGRPRKSSTLLGEFPAGGRSGKGDRLGRRSATDLARVVDQITELLSRNPKGLRAEQIRVELGLSAKEIPRPIAKALGSKRIAKSGQKRATTYFLSGGAGKASSSRARPKKEDAPSSKRSAKGRRPAEGAGEQTGGGGA
jgi:hypothetical protein